MERLHLILTIGGGLCLLTVLADSINNKNDDTGYIIVETPLGKVKGQRYSLDAGSEINVFLGIPYAKPPKGSLRFAPPEPVDQWKETLDATKPGSSCLQTRTDDDPMLTTIDKPFDEDCLVLDIYTTKSKTGPVPSQLQPTMMFIHGGGYYQGSGSFYNFTALARHGVTVVSINYRLDVFGFLSTQDETIPGNFGLLDKILALKWVKNNISPFGGNPNDVTVFGGSAGASSSSFLSLSPLSRGTFQKAIFQSGVSSCPWCLHHHISRSDVPRTLARKLGQLVGCESGDEVTMISSESLLECLRTVSGDVLLKASSEIQKTLPMAFRPVTGDAFGVIPDTPLEMLAKTSEIVPIPIIFGYTNADLVWPLSDPEEDGVSLQEFKYIVKHLIAGYIDEEVQEEAFRQLMNLYLPKEITPSTIELRQVLIELIGAGSMVACVVNEARKISKSKGNNTNIFVYEFAYRPSYSLHPEWHGAVHATEKGFVLGHPNGPNPFQYPNYNAIDKKVSDNVLQMWANFAKYGSPTPEPVDGVIWPNFIDDNGEERILLIKENLEVSSLTRSKNIETWVNIYEADAKYSRPTQYVHIVGFCIAFVIFTVAVCYKIS